MSICLADVVTECPYPGLRPFEPNEANIFFGRTQHVTDLLKCLKSQRFLGVVGPSGCGKSSLIRAGLIPKLQGGFMAKSQFKWKFAIFRPGEQPMLRLAEALHDSGIFGEPESEFAVDVEQLGEDLEAGSRSLADRLLLDERAQGANLLILVDQFEELFRFESKGGGDESRAFVNLLLETAKDPHISAYVVLTMRTDFLGQCPVFVGLPEALNESQYLTPRLTREQIETAIVGPARRCGGEVDQDVVSRILNEMGTDPDQLPLMQHLLLRMWRHATRHRKQKTPAFQDATEPLTSDQDGSALEEFPGSAEPDSEATARQMDSGTFVPGVESENPDGGSTLVEPTEFESDSFESQVVRLTLLDYRATGGLLQAMGMHAEKIFMKRLQSDRQRGLAENMFRRLTELAPNDQLVRRSPPKISELCDKADQQELYAVIETFRREGRSFLMPPPRVELDPDTRIDISHESLIRKWERLEKWTREEARWEEIRREVAKFAKNYANNGRKPEDLTIPESQLATAIEWTKKHPRDVSDEIRDFLRACKRRRILEKTGKWILAGITVAAFVLIYLITNIVHQKRATESALAGRFWRDAEQQFGTVVKGDDLGAGMLWLAEAYAMEPKADFDKAKRDLYDIRFGSVIAQHPKLQNLWHCNLLKATVVSADGKHLITASGPEDAAAQQPRKIKSDNTGWILEIWDAAGQSAERKPIHTLACGNYVNSVRINPDGHYILAVLGKAGESGGGIAVWRWDPKNPQISPVRVENPAFAVAGTVQAAEFTVQVDESQKPSRTAIVGIVQESGATAANELKFWNLTPLPPVKSDKPKEPQVVDLDVGIDAVPGLAVAKSRSFAATWGAGNTTTRVTTFRIWDIAQGKAIATPTLSSSVTSGDFSHNGRWLVTVDRAGRAQGWNAQTGKSMGEWPVHIGEASLVKFSPDDRQVLTTGADNAVRIWNVAFPTDESGETSKTAERLGTRQAEFWHESTVFDVKFSPDGRFVATAGRDRIARIWDVGTRRMALVPLHHAAAVEAMEFTGNGLQLLTQSRDTVQLWNLASENPPARILRAGDEVVSVRYSRNGECAAAIGKSTEGLDIRIWNVNDKTSRRVQAVPSNATDSTECLEIADTGTRLLLRIKQRPESKDGHTVKVWNTENETWVDLQTEDGPTIVRNAAFSPDGRLVLTAREPQQQLSYRERQRGSTAAAQGSVPWRVQLWDAITGKELANQAQPGPVNHIVWSPLGDRVVVSSGTGLDDKDHTGMARLWHWEAAPSQLVAEQDWKHQPAAGERTSNAVLFAAFSRDGKLVATGGVDDAAYVWDIAAKSPNPPRLRHASDVNHVVFSPDGKQLATSSIGDKKLCVWDVQAARYSNSNVKALHTFVHNGPINWAVFNTAGNLLATVSNDTSARIWSLSRGDLAAEFKHDGYVQSVCFADQDRKIMSVSYNGRNDGFLSTETLKFDDQLISLERAAVSDRWPQRWEWHLRTQAKLPFDKPDALRECARLLAASQLDAQRDKLSMLSSGEAALSGNASPVVSVAAAEELENLWRNQGHILSSIITQSRSHAEAAEACELAGQWFAVTWHLEREIALATSAKPGTPDEKRKLAEMYALWGRALTMQDQLKTALEKFDQAIHYESNQWRHYSARAEIKHKLEQSLEAVNDWNKAIEYAPQSQQPKLQGKRAEDYAILDEWSKVGDDFAKVFDDAPNRPNGRRAALALLITQPQNQAAYRRICDRLLNLNSESRELPDANGAAWVCVLGPGGQVDYKRVLDTAQRVVREGQRQEAKYRYLHLNTLGAAHFRAGNLKDALENLDEARRSLRQIQQDQTRRGDAVSGGRSQAATKGSPHANVMKADLTDQDGTPWDWVFLAMTYHKLQQPDPAKKFLQQAKEAFDSKKVEGAWIDQREFELLLAEATRLIYPSGTSSPGN